MSSVAMVLTGGVGLGAYQVGDYAAMSEPLRKRLGSLAGASIGAVNAARIAGSPPEQRVEALTTFWNGVAAPVSMPAHAVPVTWRHALNWMNVAQSRTLGRTGLFRPRETDIRQMTDADIRAITGRMNDTPRKCLGWRTPAEVFARKMMEIEVTNPYPHDNGKSHFA